MLLPTELLIARTYRASCWLIRVLGVTTQSMPETLTLKISGLQSTLDAVTKDDFTFTYDFDTLISGSANDNISGIYTADAAITAPAGVTYTGGFHAAIRLSSEQDSSEDS